MRVWTVHEPRTPASAEERADKILFVKDGFCWPALFVPLIWLPIQRLWLGTFIYVLIAVAAGLADYFLPLTGDAGFVLALLGNLYAGFEANDLKRRKLARRGFVQTASVAAKDREDAELIYFSGRADGAAPQSSAAVPPRAPFARGDEVLGLFPRPEGHR